MSAAGVSTPPTAELHVHIEGTLEVEAVFAIAARNGVPPPAADVEQLRSRYQFANLQSFLDLYYDNVAVLQTERDSTTSWTRTSHAARRRTSGRRDVLDPQTHLANGVPLAAVIGGLVAARGATPRHGVSAALIMCFLRHLGVDAADEMLTASLAHRDCFIGVGLDSTEIGFPNPPFQRVFERAAAEGLRLVAHAAEEGEAVTVTETLDALRVERIDHGVRAMENREVVARLRGEQVPLTVCPLSNVRLKVVPSVAAHPLARMLEAGVRATVNSDDPAYFGGYVDDNYRVVQTELNLTRDQLQQLALNPFDACSAEPAEREHGSERSATGAVNPGPTVPTEVAAAARSR